MSARDYESAMEKVRLDESARQRILAAAAAPAPRRPLRFQKSLLAAAALLALVLAPVALRGLRGGMAASNAAAAGAPQSSAAAVPRTAEAADAAPQAAADGAQNETAAQPRLAMGAPQPAAQEAAKEESGMTPFARAERLAQLLGLELDTWTEEHDTARGPQGTDTVEYTAQAGDVLFSVAEEGVYAQGAALPEPPADAGVQVLERESGGAPTKVFLPDP